MGMSHQPVTLTPEQVAELSRKLGDFRHSLNNQLTLIVSAAELMKRRPSAAGTMVDTMLGPARKIMEEMQRFSQDLERGLGITRE